MMDPIFSIQFYGFSPELLTEEKVFVIDHFSLRTKLYNASQFIIMRVESNGTRFQMKSILYSILKNFI